MFFHLVHRVSLDSAYEASFLLWHLENADRWQGQSCWAAIACDSSAVTQCFVFMILHYCLNWCDKSDKRLKCSRWEAELNVWWNIIILCALSSRGLDKKLRWVTWLLAWMDVIHIVLYTGMSEFRFSVFFWGRMRSRHFRKQNRVKSFTPSNGQFKHQAMLKSGQR